MKEIDKIRELIDSLPMSDIPIGKAYLNIRDFYNLQELVNSAIIRIDNNLKTENPRHDYLCIDMGDLNTLNQLITSYRSQIIGEEEEFINSDIDDDDEVEESILGEGELW